MDYQLDKIKFENKKISVIKMNGCKLGKLNK